MGLNPKKPAFFRLLPPLFSAFLFAATALKNLSAHCLKSPNFCLIVQKVPSFLNEKNPTTKQKTIFAQYKLSFLPLYFFGNIENKKLKTKKHIVKKFAHE